MAPSKACIFPSVVYLDAIPGAATATILYPRLSGQSDEDAEREVLAVGVSQDEFAEIQRLVGVLETEGLLYDGLAEYG